MQYQNRSAHAICLGHGFLSSTSKIPYLSKVACRIGGEGKILGLIGCYNEKVCLFVNVELFHCSILSNPLFQDCTFVSTPHCVCVVYVVCVCVCVCVCMCMCVW